MNKQQINIQLGMLRKSLAQNLYEFEMLKKEETKLLELLKNAEDEEPIDMDY